MESTLKQILSELFAVSQQLDQAREQLRQLQAAYTDLKEQKDALPPAVG